MGGLDPGLNPRRRCLDLEFESLDVGLDPGCECLDVGLDPGRRGLELECGGLDFGLDAGCEDLDL